MNTSLLACPHHHQLTKLNISFHITPTCPLSNKLCPWPETQRQIEKFCSNETQPSTYWTIPTSILTRNEHPHPKLYPVEREGSNLDIEFGYKQEMSETSKQLKKRARPEKRLKQSKESSYCGSSNLTALTPPTRKLIFKPFKTIR